MGLAPWAALLLLALASAYDVARREVPAALMLPGLAAVTAIAVAEQLLWGPDLSWPLLLYGLAANAPVMAAVYLLVRLRVLGEGDLVAYGIVWGASALDPLATCCVFPLLLTVVAYSAVGQGLVALGFLVRNLALARRELRRLPPRLRLVYALTAIPVSASKAISMRGWWYPLTFCGRAHTAFDVSEDPQEARERLRRDVERGCIGPEDTVWVTYGLPAVPFIAAGLGLALVAGDTALRALVRALTGVATPCLG